MAKTRALGWVFAAIALQACGGGESGASNAGSGAGSVAAGQGGTTAGITAGQGASGSGGATATTDAATSTGMTDAAVSSSEGTCPKKPLFGPDLPWNQDVSAAAKDAASDTLIAALQSRGFGTGKIQIDYSLDVLCAGADAPFRSFEKTENFFEGDCDEAQVPIPPGGHVEGNDGYECAIEGDCHLIVIHGPTHTLYEQWIASIDGSDRYTGGCLAVWDLDKAYPETLRGDQCSSSDAAGLPIAPLLFDADEVAAGEIKHAIRFALPNTHLRNRTYVRPATHATGAASAGDDGIPYGARLRLRADYPLESLPSDGARVVAKALQTYGMILADGGNIALMGQSDRNTEHKWEGLLDVHDLAAIEPQDFEMVEAGTRYAWDGSCVLTP
jgi:hypothetical protein